MLLYAVVSMLFANPRVVIGLGGAAAFPTCVAAVLTGKPLLLVEPNVSPGAVNRFFVRFARFVFTAFKTPETWMPSRKCAPRLFM